ncbi:hypothetical protein [Nocardiopsis nanhaiensis]
MKYLFLIVGGLMAVGTFFYSADQENPIGMALAAMALMIGGIVGGQHDLAMVLRQLVVKLSPQQLGPQAHQHPQPHPQQQPHAGPQYGQHR